MFIGGVERILEEPNIRCLQCFEGLIQSVSINVPPRTEITNRLQIRSLYSFRGADFGGLPVSGRLPLSDKFPVFTPGVNDDGEAHTCPGLPAPDVQTLINYLQKAQILIDSIVIAAADVENI